jgi:hypothetical protein
MKRSTKILLALGSLVAVAGATFFIYRSYIKKKVNNFFNDPDSYYLGRVLPQSYFDFWKKFMNASTTEQRLIKEKMENIIKGSMIKAKNHYIKWYSNPMTINKLPLEQQSKLKTLRDTFIPSIQYRINFDKNFTQNKDVQDAYAFVSSNTPNLIYLNVYNFWTGDFKGEVGLYDTITHEMSHSIDYFLNENGVVLYQKTSSMENQVGSESYIMNDQEQFARLSTFRRQFDVPPIATYSEIADIFKKAIKSKKIQSRDFNISVSSDNKNLIFTPKKGKVVISAKTKIDRLNQIWKILFFDVKIIVDGRTDANLNPLFTNFATIKAGSIYIDLQPLAQLNITTASIDKPTKTNPIYGGGMDDSQSLAFTGYSFSRIKCRNPRCNWSWKVKDGGDDLFVCHKCFTDNSKFYLKH